MPEQGTEILQLIDQCRKGERKAQEQLYRHLYGFSMAIAMRYSRDETDAAEILSHAFFKIFKSIGRYDPDKGSFHAWVKRIIINEALDLMKSRYEFRELQPETDEGPAVSNLALENMSANEIMAEIQKLPPATHAVFVLYVVDGLSHGEIAAQLQISTGTSKWHLSEARRRLQEQLSTAK